MSRGSYVLRAALGFVTGSAVGWVVHDRFDNSAAFGKCGSKDSCQIANFCPLPGMKTVRLTSPWDDNWDRRDPKSLVKPTKKLMNGESSGTLEEEIKKKTPKASRHLLLIRHGQYNESGSSDDTRMLTALGHEQADFTGRRLHDLNHTYKVLIHSSMKRAIETAKDIHKHLPNVSMVQCDLLREGAPWPPEPPSGNWKPEFKQFYQDNPRIEAAFRKYFHRANPSQEQDSFEIIVCHANVIRYFVCRALQLPPEAWLRMSLNHGSMTWITIRPNGRVALRSLGDAGYMPENKLSVI